MDSLYKKAAQGDQVAVESLVLRHTGLVKSIATRFYGRGTDPEDLLQIGYEGLLKAIRRFEPERGFCFSTYAVPLIMGEIRRFLRDDGAIKVSRSIKETAQRIRVVTDSLSSQLGREPTVGEISAQSGIEIGEIAVAVSATAPTESLYGEFVMEKITAPNPTEAEIAERLSVLQAIGSTGKKEQKLLYCRYFREMNQAKTASLLGISQAQVSRTEKKLLQKIREELQ